MTLSPPRRGLDRGGRGGRGTIVRASEELGFGWREKKKGFAGTLGETRRIQADEDKTLPQNSPPPNTQIYRRE